MGWLFLFLTACVLWLSFIPSTHQLQNTQAQVLMQVRKHLEYPSALDVWENYTGDLCNIPSTAHMSIKCLDNLVSELKIMGDKSVKVSAFNGFAVANQTLSDRFSIDSLFTTLTRLSSLRVLSLVYLGIWGSLPDKIHRLSSLEVLDLCSNYIFGSIPPKIGRLVKLQTFTVEGNYFNGTIPDSLNSFSNLTLLNLKRNRFTGQFPSSVCRISTITDIALSHNELSGKLPDMSTLSSLHVLDLRDNHFDSELPLMPGGLITALLSNNSFSGKIPAQLGILNKLQHLDLSYNHLSGTAPAALFSLPNTSYLNLAYNSITGQLPSSLSCGSKLGFVDISNNKLTGELPSCLGSTSDIRVVKFGGNCLSIDSQHQHRESYCKDTNTTGKKSGGIETGLLVAVIGGSILVLVLLAFGVLFLYRKCHSRRSIRHPIPPKSLQDNAATGVSSEVLANARFISQAAKLGTQGAPVCRLFSIEELKEATNDFDSSMFIGEGSIGKLYKGKLENGTNVAIRSLALLKKHSVQNLKVRLDLLAKLNHPNLVGLLGHCIDRGGIDESSANRVFLIYDYTPNGNYRSHLSETAPEKVLKWSDRLAILIGVAKAVHYLHTGVIPGGLNNRLKTNNILLDEHRIAKLSDYGISIITEDFKKLEAKGEGPKSSQNRKLEDDVYNFGFILLESLVGPIVEGKEDAFLLNEMSSFGSQDSRKRIMDPVVLTTCSHESMSIVISITNKCICHDLSLRPSFEDVLWNLQYAAQVQATADADQKSDATSQ